MLKTFTQSKKYLYSLIPKNNQDRFLGKNGLLRMRGLLNKLGNPHKKFKSIHITGTSGKGSTAYLISNIVRHAGYKTGLHVSPHLEDIRERMQINERMIGRKDFVDLVNKVKQTIDKTNPNKFGSPTYFEALFAITFLYFAKQKIDLGVVEVGCGGRFDGTNVLEPEIAVITNIGLDHVRILGNTREKILRDKMQIIKNGCKYTISGIEQKNLQQILKRHCQVLSVPLEFIKTNKNIKTSLLGEFQKQNASLASAAACKFNIDQNIIKKALLSAHFPGRMEIVQHKPLIVLDGAHNQDKIKALVESMRVLYTPMSLRGGAMRRRSNPVAMQYKRIITVFGVKKDKDVKPMIKLLSQISNKFIITQFGAMTDLGDKFHYKAGELCKVAQRILPQAKIYLETDSLNAVKKARELAGAGDIILITGSLYLIGEIRRYLLLKK